MNIVKKRRKTAYTSIVSHGEEIASGNYKTQESQILRILEGGRVMNKRQIHKEMCARFKPLDPSSAARAINMLVNNERIVIDKLDKCPYTGKTVRFYKIKKHEPERLQLF
ncbi:MAG TPA: hypothetical protein PKA00_11155 [Saprospiraceae bacterium]|nr:hypothetical protein [Saprospiraceae bacterium]HMQ83460.1 hypothetical protein [Saprospiraceae bacterium]